MMLQSPESALVPVSVYNSEEVLELFRFRIRIVPMPLEIQAAPERLPQPSVLTKVTFAVGLSIFCLSLS